MLKSNKQYLPGDELRAHWMRMDTAGILKRFFFCERSLINSQAAWVPAIAPFALKMTLPRFIWEDAMTANALRDRVFELRYPSRLLEIGSDAPLLEVLDQALNAPGPEAFVLSMGRVFKPAIAEAYKAYLDRADEIADGPTRRFLRAALEDLSSQIRLLNQFAEEMLATAPTKRSEAEAWVQSLDDTLKSAGGVSLEEPRPLTLSPNLAGCRPFRFSEVAARDPRFHRCRFYWPDIIDPDYPYGEGVHLQLRSAVSHINEMWAIETGAAIIYFFAELLGWELIFDAARWTFDESRHCRMGFERLTRWGFEPHEIPLGSYIYDSAIGQDPLFRIGMLAYFETKNIGKKNLRAKAFADYGDRLSQHDMEFDWADETIHAHYGSHWLGVLRQKRPNAVPDVETLRERCDKLVATVVCSTTEAERADIYEVAGRMIAKAERLATMDRMT